MASSLDSDVPSSMTLQVVSKHCTCIVPLLRAANYARSLERKRILELTVLGCSVQSELPAELTPRTSFVALP